MIEVMIALVIFSLLIGMSSRFIAAGIQRPFVADRVEPWLRLMEESRVAIENLSPDKPIFGPGIHPDPFPELVKPAALSSWQMEWQSTSLAGARAALFTAKTKLNKTVEWYVFLQSN